MCQDSPLRYLKDKFFTPLGICPIEALIKDNVEMNPNVHVDTYYEVNGEVIVKRAQAKNKKEIRRFVKLSTSLLVGVTFAAFLLAACTGQSNETSTQTQNNLKAAPEIRMTLYSGEEFNLSDFRGKPVVINFWFPSCPPCRAEMPDLENAWQNHKADGLVFIGVQLLGVDGLQDGKDFIEEVGVTYPVGADEDGQIFIDYGVSGFPSTIFITKAQEIAKKWTGALDAKRLEELIQEIL